MKKWELELENENLKKNCKTFLKENEILKIRISEEGLPKKADNYFIAYNGGPLGLVGTLPEVR